MEIFFKIKENSLTDSKRMDIIITVCKNIPLFLCPKAETQQPAVNITGGERNANIQPVSEKGKTDQRKEIYRSGSAERL